METERIQANDSTGEAGDFIKENIKRLKDLFPEIIVEGSAGVSVNIDILKQLVGDRTVSDVEEKYGLNWAGKRQARQMAITPPEGTLRPFPEESIDWDSTKNVMIEGDNLEVLKLLQKGYAGKVKLIYIDPPYNTGEDFIYPDNFQDNIKNYLELTGQTENGKQVTSNPETSGRFHTNWLNMMYPRLKLARNLLRNDGTIFISIDDNEVANLRKLCDEIFGEENFEGHIHWRRRHNQPNDPTKMIAIVAEHLIVYAKNKNENKNSGVGKIPLTGKFSNPDNDPRGDWASKPWKSGSGQSGSRYKITTPTGQVFDEEWMGEEATYKNLLADNRIFFPRNQKGPPRKKYFRFEREEEGQCATNWWLHQEFGHNQGANITIENLFEEKNVFSNPKPMELIQGIICVANTKKEDIVLDFFAGSGTTGHAIMSQNVTDDGNRRYILVQLPERLDPENKDQKIAADFCDQIGKPRTIAELTKERLRRAGDKIRSNFSNLKGATGFRVFKLDTSNIRQWNPDPTNIPKTIFDHQEHVLSGRSEGDLLYELLIRLGKDLSTPIEKREVAGKTLYSVDGGRLMTCLAEKLNEAEFEKLGDMIRDWHRELDKNGEITCVFRDSAFPSAAVKLNLVAMLEQYGINDFRSL